MYSHLAILISLVCSCSCKFSTVVQNDLQNFFENFHDGRNGGDRCMDRVRCFMSRWDFLSELSTELSQTSRSLFWVVEPPVQWWMNVENKSPNYTVSLGCRAQSYDYDSEVFYQWKKIDIGNKETLIDIMDSRISIVSGRLEINQPRNSDSGIYRCFATNQFGTIVSRESHLRVGKTPTPRDRLSADQLRLSLTTSETRVLPCEGERTAPRGTPGLEFMWKRNYNGAVGTPREEWIGHDSDDTKFIEASTGALYLLQPKTTDSGLYQCLFRNVFERVQMDGAFDWVATQPLDVTFVSGYSSEKVPQIVAQSTSVRVERNFNLTLTCAFTMGASGGSTRKTYSVSWNTPSKRAPQYLHGGVTLFLEKAQLSDSGEYTCTVFDDNIPRRYDEKGFQVTVYSPPYFTVPLPESVELRPAQDFTLSCEAAAEPAAEYKWYIDGVLQRVFQSSYEIETADIGDMGVYQCEASNEYGTSVTSSTVRVIAMEPLFQTQLEPATDRVVVAGQGETALIHCDPFCLATPIFQWARTNVVLVNSTGVFPKYTSYPNGTLRINNVQLDDAGNYICKATSGGSADNTYQLKVTPPLSLEVEASGKYVVLLNRTVNLSCKLRAPPETDGVFLWYLNDQLLNVTPPADREQTQRRLLKLDEIFGSRDFYYSAIKEQKLDVNNLPPYFYPEQAGNPFYPEGGWGGGSKQGSPSSFYPALNNQYARYDILRKAEQFDPFNPYLTSSEYLQEERDRHFVILKHYLTDLSWYVQDIDPLSQHYIRLKSDSSNEGDLQVYRAQMWQKGDYRCCFATAVSSTCASMALDVIGVPGRVGNVHFILGTYELQWGVPAENGSPITAFVVEASAVPSVLVAQDAFLKHQTTELGDVADVYAPDYAKFVKILEVEGVQKRADLKRFVKPYCQYRFRVTAVNEVGRGTPSHPSPVYNTREGEPITKVQNISEYFGNPGDLSFQWAPLDATDFGSSDAIWYRVTYTPMYSSSSSDPRQRATVNVEGFPLMHRLTIPASQLPANPSPNIRRKYLVSVQLENAHGPGPLGDSVEIYTLPLAPTQAPTNVFVIKDSGTSVRVTFNGIDLKFEDEETFQGYIVEYWRYDLEDLDKLNTLYEVSPGNRTDTRKEEVYVYDLQPSMNYKFVVRAYNLAGQGPPSKQVAGETYDSFPTEAPKNVEAFAYSNVAVRVRWQPITLHSGESQLDGYKVFYRKYGLPDNDTHIYDWRRRERDETEVLLHGLDSGERYILQVQAYNRGGFGPRSDPVIFLMRYTRFNELWQDSSLKLQLHSAMLLLTLLFHCFFFHHTRI